MSEHVSGAISEQMLISSILRQENFATAINRGVSADLFHHYKPQFEWIESYYKLHGSTPSVNAFKTRFSGENFEVLKSSESDTAHFSDQVVQEHTRIMIAEYMREGMLRLKKGTDATEILDYFHMGMMGIKKNIGLIDDGDIFSDNTDILMEIEKRRKKYLETGAAGIPSGFVTFDSRTGGFQPGEFHMFCARMGVGKAQPLTANVLTPFGYEKMGNIKVGDKVIGSDGHATKVIAIHPQPYDLEIYNVHINDGTVVPVNGEHLWTVGFPGKGFRVQTTEQLMDRANSKDNNTTINLPSFSSPVEFETDTALKYHPYLLGLLLGDGSFRGKDGLVRMVSYDYGNLVEFFGDSAYKMKRDNHWIIKDAADMAYHYGLMGKFSYEKFIPAPYLQASVEDRIALLQGLMDSDGYNNPTAGCELTTTSEQLRDDLIVLIQSLGGYTTVTERMGSYVKDGVRTETRLNWRVRVKLPGGINPFRLERKNENYTEYTKYVPTRKIVGIERTGIKVPMQCITVEAPDSLYATEGMVLTHNSWLLQKMAASAAQAGHTVQFDALEQTRTQAATRIYSMFSQQDARNDFVARNLMQGHGYDPDEFAAYLVKLQRDVAGRLHVSDGTKGKTTVSTVAAQIERNNPDIVFIDYFGLMGMASRDYMGMGETAADLTQLALQYEIPIVCAAQLNRGGTADDASLETIAGSDEMARYATTISFVRRPAEQVFEMRCEKSRNTGSDFQFYAKFAPERGVFKEVSYETAQDLIEQEKQAAALEVEAS